MTFKEFYDSIETDITFNGTTYVNKEAILDDCKDTLDGSWDRKTDSQKIEEFSDSLVYWVKEYGIKPILKYNLEPLGDENNG